MVAVLYGTFGFDEQQLGTVIATGMSAATIVLASSYFWLGRIARRVAIVTGILLALLGLLFAAMASGFWFVALSFAVLASGLALTAAPTVTALAALSNPTRAFAVSLTTMVLIAGLHTYLVQVVFFPAFGYIGVLTLLAGTVGITLLLIPLIPPASAIGADQPTGKAGGTQRLSWAALGVMVIYFAGLNSNFAFLERVGSDALLEPEAIGTALSISIIVGAIGSVLAVIVHDRIKVTSAFMVTVVGGAMYAAIMWQVESALEFAAAIVLLNIAWNFALPYTMEMVSRFDGGNRLTGLIPAAQSLGGGIGPLVAGVLVVRFGFSALYVFFLILLTFCAIAYHRLERE